MVQLSEVAKVTPINRQVIPWAEYEPLLSQLLQATSGNQHEVMRLIGYAGGTHVAEWKKTGHVPLVAKLATLWVLHDLRISPRATKQRPVQHLTLEELGDLFSAVRGLPVGDSRGLVRKLAAMMAEADS